MSRQHGIHNVARNIALFGAAYWAAERVQAGSLSSPWIQAAEKFAPSAISSEGQNRASRDSPRPESPSALPSLLGAFGPAPLVSLQPLSSSSTFGGSNLSAWQPSCYVSPDTAYERGVSAPASIFKGDASHTHRAATLASEYPEIAKAIQKLLDERGIRLPACHFHTPDVELVRYAITVGLLTARTPDERRKVIEAAAHRAQATAEWLDTHEFLPQAELSQWVDVVHWAKDDPEGRPVLVVHLRAALQQDAAGAKCAGEAILTHMECALRQRLRDDMSGPEQVVVVLDSRGAPTLKFRRLVTAIQNIALTLNRHYPARLYRLFLVDAPAIVHIPVRAIKAMLHPSTSSKILICDLGDERLPLDLDKDAALHKDART